MIRPSDYAKKFTAEELCRLPTEVPGSKEYRDVEYHACRWQQPSIVRGISAVPAVVVGYLRSYPVSGNGERASQLNNKSAPQDRRTYWTTQMQNLKINVQRLWKM
jgi:hypothetical protein